MKFRKTGALSFILVLGMLAFIGCANQPDNGNGSTNSGQNPGTNSTQGYGISITATNFSAFPGSYTSGDSVPNNFTVTAENTGFDMPSDKMAVAGIAVAQSGGLNLDQLQNSGSLILQTNSTSLPSNQTLTYNVKTNISVVGYTGANYFYAVAYICDTNTSVIYCSDVRQLNTLPAVKFEPYTNWATVNLAGGNNTGSSSGISRGQWYSNSISGTSPVMYYQLSVTAGSTNYVFVDNGWDGSSTYDGDISVTVYDQNGTSVIGGGTLYNYDSAYINPLPVIPTGSKIYIELTSWKMTSGGYGAFAFGVR
jgi:hypothetical protein